MSENLTERLAGLEERLTTLEVFVDLLQRVPLFAREIGMHQQFCGAREAEKKSEAAQAAKREAGRPQREADFRRFCEARLVVDGNPARATTQGHIELAYRTWASEQHILESDRLTGKELSRLVLSLPGIRESKGMSHCRAVVDIVLGVCVRREFRAENDHHNGPSVVQAEHEELRRQQEAARPKPQPEEPLYA